MIAGLRQLATSLRSPGRRSRKARAGSPFKDSFRTGAGTYLGNNRVLVRVDVNKAILAFILPADDLLITPWFIVSGEYEPEVTAYLLSVAGEDTTFIDVGANFGFYTCLMARSCLKGRAVGIEADQRLHDILRDNIAINGMGQRARAIHAAAGANGEPMMLHRRVTRPGNTSIVFMDEDFTTAQGEPPVESFSVKGVRIDDVAQDLGGVVDVMKIDVEGAEPLVIQGATKTITANPHLKIVMEWSPGQIQGAGFDVASFVDQIAGLGLQPHVVVEGKAERISADALRGLAYQAGVMLTRS